MHWRVVDRTGQRVGRWTVLRYAGKSKWLCRCDCGRERNLESDNLRRKNTSECRECALTHMHGNPTHGQSGTRLYNVWAQMRRRCYQPTDAGYVNYGGRGIRVCEEWQQFEPFYEWAIRSGYDPQLTIDRRNNDGNYEPANCRWTDVIGQVRNRRVTRQIEIDGTRLPVATASEVYGVNYDALIQRLDKLKWSPERALKTPVRYMRPRHAA